MKRLFVSDLDGTLLNKDANLSEFTVETINQLIDQGENFTISTARSPATTFTILKPLNLRLPIMLMNGVLIYDWDSNSYIKKELIGIDTVMVVLGMIKIRHLDCFMYGFANEELCAYYDSVESTMMNYFRNEAIMKYDKKFTEVEDLSLKTKNDIIYFMLRESKEKLEGLYRDLSVVKGVKAEFYPDVYNDAYYLEIYSDKASKKDGVEYIKEKGNYDSVTGFGDNLNDMPLLEACDYFYAVENANPVLKEKATAVIPSNIDEGVPKYIKGIVSFE